LHGSEQKIKHMVVKCSEPIWLWLIIHETVEICGQKKLQGLSGSEIFEISRKKVAIAILRGQMWLHNIKKKPLKT
jgi:hypothetical protein